MLIEIINKCLINIYSYWVENFFVAVVQLLTAIPYGIAFWKNRKAPLLQWVAVSCVGFAFGYILMGAYSGMIIAVGTFIATVIGIAIGKRKEVSLKVRWLCFVVLLVLTTGVSLLVEQTPLMWLILVAGFLDYFAYIVCVEYHKTMHIVLICSQITLVVYEIIYLLYFFALLDFVTTLIITFHFWKRFYLRNEMI